MNTPALSQKLTRVSTEELMEELVARRHALVTQLDSVLKLWKGPAVPSLPGAAAEPKAAKAPASAAAPAKKAAKKSAGAKPGPAKKAAAKGSKRPRSADGKTIADYALEALADGEARKPKDLVAMMTKAGWTTTSSDPAKVLGTTLKKLADGKKLKFLGDNTFKA